MTSRQFYERVAWTLVWVALILGNLATIWAMRQAGDTLPALLGVECGFFLVAAILIAVIADL